MKTEIEGYWQERARELAFSFADRKAEDFLKRFFADSGLDEILAEHLRAENERIIKETGESYYDLDEIKNPALIFAEHFKRWLMMTYSIGYLDGIEKQKHSKLFVPSSRG